MKKKIAAAFIVTLVTSFSAGTAIAALLTCYIDGYYHNRRECVWCGGLCSDDESISDLSVSIFYNEVVDDLHKVCQTLWDTGLMEFDISSLQGVLTRGQVQADLFLKVNGVDFSSDECLSFYSIPDGYENGMLEIADKDTTDYLGDVCGNSQPGEIVTVNVTAAVEHDLFDPDQTDYSGFVIQTGQDWQNGDYVSFYDYTSSAYGPILCIRDTNSNDDSDTDCAPDSSDKCPNVFDPFQEDSYPPQGNGIGDACDCEGNFNCDTDNDVDGSDAATFKQSFGRSPVLNPCTTESPCHGDFNCDHDCDGTDAARFKQDFGRSASSNPCPVCVMLDWCAYHLSYNLVRNFRGAHLFKLHSLFLNTSA